MNAGDGDVIVVHVGADELPEERLKEIKSELEDRVRSRGISVLVITGDAVQSVSVARAGTPVQLAVREPDWSDDPHRSPRPEGGM